MSGWRLAVRALYDRGPSTSAQIESRMSGAYAASALTQALRLGLVKSPGRCGFGNLGLWSLTERGVDWCEGRLALAPAPHKKGAGRPGYRFVATWLASLPRGIRINQ